MGINPKQAARKTCAKKEQVCCYCDAYLGGVFTVEHILPLCYGGGSHYLNVFPCCESCNQERGNKSYDYWFNSLSIQLIYDPNNKFLIKKKEKVWNWWGYSIRMDSMLRADRPKLLPLISDMELND